MIASMYDIFYTDEARNDLMKLPTQVAGRIVKKVCFYLEQSDPMIFAKSLQGNLKGRYRFRIGDYRVIFKVNATGQIFILYILAIKHRKDVYGL